jgi:hypothetical protein
MFMFSSVMVMLNYEMVNGDNNMRVRFTWQYGIKNDIYLFILKIQKHMWKTGNEVEVQYHITASWTENEPSFVVEDHCECNILWVYALHLEYYEAILGMKWQWVSQSYSKLFGREDFVD